MISGSSGCQRSLIEPGHQHRRFGLSVALAKTGTEHLDASFELGWRDWRRGKEKNAQARVVESFEIGVR
jgi:hypothetical protein